MHVYSCIVICIFNEGTIPLHSCIKNQPFLHMYVSNNVTHNVMLIIFLPVLCVYNCAAGATSTGLSIKILQKCAAYATGSAFVLLSAPPTPPGGRGGLFGVQGGSSSKALCYNICFSIQTGKSLGQIELLPTSQLHCALTKGASMMAMGKILYLLLYEQCKLCIACV